MSATPRPGRVYSHIHIGGSSRAHLGDVHNHGSSADERALRMILESLKYPSMHDRRDNLVDAHQGTFDWTFLEGEVDFVTNRYMFRQEEDHGSVRIRMNFKSWLRDDDQGLFVFTGKPGSGKSTFMKRLASDGDIARVLRDWTFGRTLLRADHCFWVTGSPMQKSLEGMLRSLIYSVLRSLLTAGIPGNIKAIQNICGDRWSSASTHASWSCAELKGMLTRLSSLEDIRSFFLIDALDECDPPLYELVDEILRISRLPNIKICVSCRPWKVFTNRFEGCQTLRLDELTYCDMETYIRSRLLTAEEEGDIQTEIRDGGLPAKQFIWQVASAAQGVFLWTKLVTDELCIEVRKGRSVEMLDRILSRIPTDLDDYFHRLIFDRIGKSRQNSIDTAAALRLAVEIHVAHEYARNRNQFSWEGFPDSHSFINFWLLSNRCLGAGFSWEDYPRIVQPGTEHMIKQTVSFLEEACKELLVLTISPSEPPHRAKVDFFHRTVFDYLFDNPDLFKDAPSHFSDHDFITELFKLRCICVLRTEHKDCKELLATFHKTVMRNHPSCTAAWTQVCETLVNSRIHGICVCSGLGHLSYGTDITRRSLSAGYDGFVCEEMRRMPHLAVCEPEHGYNGYDPNAVGSALQAMHVLDTRPHSHSMSLRKFLECGSDPNALSNHTLPFSRAFLSGPDTPPKDNDLYCHRRTHWETWLRETYLQVKRCPVIARRTLRGYPRSAAIRITQQNMVDTIEVLLRYGADPQLSICITDHAAANFTVSECTSIGLREVLALIVPEDSTQRFQDLRSMCANTIYTYTSRRNQRRRAARSLLTSEQNLRADVRPSRVTRAEAMEQFQTESLEGIMSLASSNPKCRICRQEIYDRWPARPVLASWCIECGELCCLCLRCSGGPFAASPTFEDLCETVDGSGATRTHDHTSVSVVFRLSVDYEGELESVSDGHLEALRTRYSTAQAFSVIKEWYAKNPIKPDLSFEEAFGEIPSDMQP